MLTWASYLFGGDSQDRGGAATTQPDQQPHLEMTERDDWLLINKIDELSAMHESKHESTTGKSDLESELEFDDGDGKENKSERPSSEETGHSSGVSTDDASWYVTPPPCFTSTHHEVSAGGDMVENLLIEHPSMSVYHSISHPKSPPHSSSSSQVAVPSHDPPRYRHHNQTIASYQAALPLVRREQQGEQRQQKKRLKSRPMERKNKSHEYASHGKHMNRKYFINQPRSHACSH